MEALASCGGMKAGEFFLGDGFERSGERRFALRLLSWSGGVCRFGLLVRRAIAVPDAVAVFADLIDGAIGDGTVGVAFGDGWLVFSSCEFVAVFDEEPVGFAGTCVAGVHANERPATFHLLALEIELEMAFGKGAIDVGVS